MKVKIIHYCDKSDPLDQRETVLISDGDKQYAYEHKHVWSKHGCEEHMLELALAEAFEDMVYRDGVQGRAAAEKLKRW